MVQVLIQTLCRLAFIDLLGSKSSDHNVIKIGYTVRHDSHSLPAQRDLASEIISVIRLQRIVGHMAVPIVDTCHTSVVSK